MVVPPHLAEGSDPPPAVEKGKLRLYSMEYCPYAHRSRLILEAKKVPYEVVNINLVKKPKWFFDIHPEGKVPALDVDGKIVVESLDICDFLDEKYPEPALYATDPGARAEESELLEKMGPLIMVYNKLVFKIETKTPEEWLDSFNPHLQVYEDALKIRGTTFFGGNAPGMVDYMLWPWAERVGTIGIVLGQTLPLPEGTFSALRAWRTAMRGDKPVKACYTGPEKFHKIMLIKIGELPPDYDAI